MLFDNKPKLNQHNQTINLRNQNSDTEANRPPTAGIRTSQKCNKYYIYCVFFNLECSKAEQSVYLLRLLQFGEIKNVNKLIFTVVFAIRRARQRDHSGAMSGKVQNSIYLLCFLQFGEPKSVK